MLWIPFLLVLAVSLEQQAGRPFLASLWGRLLARALRGERLSRDLYEVPTLPAVGFRAAAQTWGETVLVVPELLANPGGARILEHERYHVEQYGRLTSFGFWLVYFFQWLTGLVRYGDAFRAYWEIRLEVEARESAVDVKDL